MKVIHIPTGTALFVLKRIGGNDRLCIAEDGRRIVVSTDKIRQAPESSSQDSVLEEDASLDGDDGVRLEHRQESESDPALGESTSGVQE